MGQIPGYLNQAYQPWMQGGQNQFQQAGNQYSQLMNDPGAMMAKFGSGYQQSPGYKWQVDQALGAANRSAAAGGMAGSPEEQQNIAGTVNNLANQDYYNYLNNVTGLYGQGLQGANYQSGLGYQAGNEYGQNMAQYLMGQANLGYANAQNQNQHSAGEWSGIGAGLGAIGGLAAML